MAPTLFFVSVMVFLIMRLVPGDVVSLMFQDLGYAESLAEMRTRLGLDLPLHEQYLRWIADLLRGDLGQSLWTQRTVVSVMAERLPVTLELALLSIAFSVVYGGVTGAIAAVHQDRAADVALRSFAMAFLSLPTFWLGTLVIVLPSLWLGWSPSIRLVPLSEDPLGNLTQFALPAAILGSHLGAPVMRMSRAMLLEAFRQDYVRTAWAKGLEARRVVYKHALRNAVIPTVNILGVQVSQAIAGSIVLETLFGLPGMGSLLVEAVAHRDFPMFQSLVLCLGLFVIVINLLVDLACVVIDPRLRVRHG
jgi:peptide/nickel transport system permease protein